MGLFTAFSAMGKGADGKLIATILRELQKPLLAYEMVTTSIESGGNTVNHRLGRTPMGWIVVDKDDIVDMYRESWDSTKIIIQADAAANVTFLIF
jgi:hypothetical protein